MEDMSACACELLPQSYPLFTSVLHEHGTGTQSRRDNMLTTMLTPIWAGTNQVNFFPFDESPTENPHLGIASRHFPLPTAFHNQNPPNSFPPPPCPSSDHTWCNRLALRAHC